MFDVIYGRRSIRKYQNKPIEKEKLNEVLRAAMYAPSAMNKQPWHFVVCEDRAVLGEIQRIHAHASMLESAPCCIVVAGDLDAQYMEGSYIQDCAAAVENLLLAAYSVGLGTCWLGVYPDPQRQENFRKFFKMPENIKPFCAIAIGYPDEKKELPDRFSESKIHYEQW